VKWIVFFDGECGFCSRGIRWLAKLDRHDRIRFSPLQGELAKSHGITMNDDPAEDTMIVVRERDGAIFSKSDGLLEISRALGFPFALMRVFALFPRVVRDAVYRWIARNRYRWFGKADTCQLPSPEVVKRLV
jgi:predicted DCC family thiol-disulfide oxidoreductase YuxK